MAIPYVGKLFESTAATQFQTMYLTTSIKAGTLICIAMCGRRSSTALNISSVADAKGNSWNWIFRSSTDRGMGVAWTRTKSAMTTSDWITTTWNGTPSASWRSAHAYENASGNHNSSALTISSSNTATASATVSVTGSDWLVFASVILPYDYGIAGQVGINSGILRDDNGNTSIAPWAECVSRNGTTGSSYQAGIAYAVPIYWGAAAVAFPYEAMPSGRSMVIYTG
jgi:hypothetical protein